MGNIELIKEIRTAIKQNNVERVVELIGSDMELMNMVTTFGTWLHVAATHGKLEIVKRLIDLGADINKRGGVFGGGAINVAASEGHIDIVRCLLSNGAEIDVSEPERNPLFAAIRGGHIDIVKLLIENGIDIHVTYTGESMKNMDALAFAHERGQKEIANLLDSAKKEEYKDTAQNKTNEILDYIREHFGPIYHTISEIVLGSKVTVDIQIILPTKDRDFITLVTTGMSDVAMDETEESVGSRYAELVLKLPANWPISKDEMGDNVHFWPLKWLRMVAHIPHSYDGWLEAGVVLPNGDPPMPFASNTALSCILISKSEVGGGFVNLENRVIDFYTLLPIYEEERKIALQKGYDYLIEKYDENGVSDVLDIKRKNIGLNG
ncbi:suppressor of fused domain protein [Solibacillus sp. FSL R7-0682]|uniref:suppressor of fused domain protein n=1 Tax=Solibacillus sp. FSL R7-0682 TaxID=2921690 RepID=UPI0030FB1E5E